MSVAMQGSAEFFDLTITYYPDDEIWVGVCDDLGIAMESSSFNDLIERTRQVAPEMYELNFGSNAFDSSMLPIPAIAHLASAGETAN